MINQGIETKIGFMQPLNVYKLKRKGIDFTKKYEVIAKDVKMDRTMSHLEK